MHGSKPSLLTSVGWFSMGSVLCRVSRDMPSSSSRATFKVRVVVGCCRWRCSACFLKACPPNFRGMLGAASGLSTLEGPLVCAYLVAPFSWRLGLLHHLPLGLLAAAVLVSQFPCVKPGQRGRIDCAGAILLYSGLVSLLLSINRQPTTVGGRELLNHCVRLARRGFDRGICVAALAHCPPVTAAQFVCQA